MKENTTAEGVYSNAQLAAAIAASRSWRGVMRHLGLSENSPRPTRVMRQRAERLGLDTSHFAGSAGGLAGLRPLIRAGFLACAQEAARSGMREPP